MKYQVNVHEAKTHLSRLIQEVGAGKEVIIAKSGKPVARLIAYHAPEFERKPGLWRGQVEMAPEFDSLPSAVQAAFRGEAE